MAVTEIVMPSMGADMTEGSIVRWLKSEGDEVARGDVLAEVETDKAVVEMESYGAGILRKILVEPERVVPVGQVIAYIADPGDELPDARPEAGAPPAAAVAEQAAVAPETPAPAPASGRVKASPIARKLAAANEIDLATLTGTGPGGRIQKSDVEAAIAAREAAPPPAAPPVPPPATAPAAPVEAPAATLPGENIPLTGMRQAIARVTVRSKTEAPHFYVTAAIDMTEAMSLRQRLNEALADEGVRISVNDMIVKATVDALVKHPKFNASFDGDRLVGHADINMGIAIALESGLIVPAILACQGKSLRQLAIEAHDLGARTRNGTLTQAEMTAATFSISNLGMFDVEQFIAIIVPPQAGILAVGRVSKTPVVKDGEIVVADVMKSTVSIDHRVADGAEAAVFLGEIKRSLENPLSMLA